MEHDQPQFGLGKSIAFSLILITLSLLAAEAVVRGWAYYLRDPYQRFDSETGAFSLVPGEHRTRTSRVVINAAGFVGDELEAPGEDLWRIVALGDSCTFGPGNAVGTYSAMAEERLARQDRNGLRYEVVNAGVEGLSSAPGLQRLRSKVLPLDPEVVSVYLGWNDLMKYDPLAQGDSEYSGTARVLGEFWLVRGLRKLLFYHLRPQLFPPATGEASFTGRFADFRPTLFESNLRTIISEIRQAGAHPMAFTLPTVVRPEMTPEDLVDANVMFPYFSTGYGVGDFLDLLGSYNDTIRAVARDMDVPIVELALEFEKLPDIGTYFFDTMHTTRAGQSLIARLFTDKLAAEGLLGPSSPAPAAAQERSRESKPPTVSRSRGHG